MKDTLFTAQQLGTFQKDDRSKQYPLNTQQQVIDAVNLALTNVRRVERQKNEDLKAVRDELKLAYKVIAGLVLVLTSPAWLMLATRFLGR